MNRKAAVALIAIGTGLAFGGGALWFVHLMEAEHSWADIGVAPGLWVAIAGAICAVAGLFLYGRGLSREHDTPATFLTPAEDDALMKAIEAFEKKTSGELRIHLESKIDGVELMESARQTFAKLGLTATRDKNGVLFFVAVKERRFAVLGDSGIDQKVPAGFWNDVVAKVGDRFKQGKFGEGLIEGVHLAGDQLAAHFPPRPDDVDELPNTISRGTT